MLSLMGPSGLHLPYTEWRAGARRNEGLTLRALDGGGGDGGGGGGYILR